MKNSYQVFRLWGLAGLVVGIAAYFALGAWWMLVITFAIWVVGFILAYRRHRLIEREARQRVSNANADANEAVKRLATLPVVRHRGAPDDMS